MNKLLYFAFLLAFFALTSAKCPRPEVLNPCKCTSDETDGNEIFCQAVNSTLDLKSVFQRVTLNTKSNERHFKTFTLEDRKSESIEADVFGNITFEEIVIFSPDKLKRIHSKAFASTATTLRRFSGIVNWVAYRNQPAPYNTFDMLNSLVNAQEVNFFPKSVPDIPTRAFNLTKLETLFYSCGPKQNMTIGDYAFSGSNNLSFIGLTDAGLKKISKNAFNFEKESNTSLLIWFSFNKLNSTSFEDGAFAGFKRPTKLVFNNNKITYLKETVFRPFLDADKRNVIQQLIDNPINCTDCRNYWVVKDKDKYQKRVLQANCKGQKKKTIFDQKWNCPNV